jgi:predicted metal-dependent peptidase
MGSFEDFYGYDKAPVLPSRYDEKLNELIVIVDVSGSNAQAANAIFPELISALNASGFGNESSLRLVSFNTKVEDEYIFSFNPKSDYDSMKTIGSNVPDEKIIIPDSDSLIGQDDLNRFNWYVGGGTIIAPVFKALDSLPKQPPFVVVLTDGEFYGEESKRLAEGNITKSNIIWVMTIDNGIDYPGYRTYKLYDMDY